MATTSLWKVKNRLDHLVDYVSNYDKTSAMKNTLHYISNEDKTEDKRFVSCINCSVVDPHASMKNTKKMFKDNKDIVCFHGYQSFVEEEVTPAIAHEIGVKLAKKVWGDRFEVIVTTHLNTKNIHNHILINATSFVDGKRFCNTKKDLYRMRTESDRLCKEYNLSVIEEYEKDNNRKKPNNYQTKRVIEMIKKDAALYSDIAHDSKEFKSLMALEGYQFINKKGIHYIKHPSLNYPIVMREVLDIGELVDNFEADSNNHQTKSMINYQDNVLRIMPYYEKYKRNNLDGLQRLLLHWQYLLGIIPKIDTRNTKLSAECVEALKELDNITDQLTMICKNDIKKIDELHDYKQSLSNSLQELLKKRSHSNNKIKKYKENPKMIRIYKEKNIVYNESIKELRHQIKMCNMLEERTIPTATKYVEANEKLEENRHERNKVYKAR